ncbi:SDR family oxidoreductase [Pelomyxa schiedti]|nr:SDR family oxidoreductase [Pelomyxa schiedti]
MDLADKVVVITGASGGIGEECAVALSSKGAKLVLVARRRDQLERVAERCRASYAAASHNPDGAASRFVVFDADVTAREQVDKVAAAAGLTCPTSRLSDADLDQMITVNVKSALYGMQAAVAHFRQRRSSPGSSPSTPCQVINVSSMLARIPYVNIRSAYCAAKAALDSLTATLRCEVRGEGIHVTSVHPGPVATDFGNNAVHGGPDSRTFQGAQSPQEVAGVIVDAVLHPRADVYTRPGYQAHVSAYYSAANMEDVECGWGARSPTAPTVTPPPPTPAPADKS